MTRNYSVPTVKFRMKCAFNERRSLEGRNYAHTHIQPERNSALLTAARKAAHILEKIKVIDSCTNLRCSHMGLSCSFVWSFDACVAVCFVYIYLT